MWYFIILQRFSDCDVSSSVVTVAAKRPVVAVAARSLDTHCKKGGIIILEPFFAHTQIH
jgi:hypothetical protein